MLIIYTKTFKYDNNTNITITRSIVDALQQNIYQVQSIKRRGKQSNAVATTRGMPPGNTNGFHDNEGGGARSNGKTHLGNKVGDLQKINSSARVQQSRDGHNDMGNKICFDKITDR